MSTFIFKMADFFLQILISADNTVVQLQEIMTTKLKLVERNLTESLLKEVTMINRYLEVMKEYKSYAETVSQSYRYECPATNNRNSRPTQN